MRWKAKYGECDKCGCVDNLVPSFGKYICNNCKENRPNKGQGNSGMSMIAQIGMSFNEGISLVRVKKSNGLFGHYYFSHYPNSKGIPGRSLCYLVYSNNDLIGIIGASSPPCNYNLFRNYFNCDNDNCFVNNNVFRMLSHEKNLGTRVLKIFRKRIYNDYYDKYKQNIMGIVTFVEPPRTGAIYKADNWDYIGETQGKRMTRDKDTWEKIFKDGTVKHIYGYKYKNKDTTPNTAAEQ